MDPLRVKIGQSCIVAHSRDCRTDPHCSSTARFPCFYRADGPENCAKARPGIGAHSLFSIYAATQSSSWVSCSGIIHMNAGYWRHYLDAFHSQASAFFGVPIERHSWNQNANCVVERKRVQSCEALTDDLSCVLSDSQLLLRVLCVDATCRHFVIGTH